jgi:hypothetical protein
MTPFIWFLLGLNSRHSRIASPCDPVGICHRRRTMRAPYSNKTRRRCCKPMLVAAVLIVAMIAPTITSSATPSSADRDEEAVLHVEAQRRQLVVLPAPQIILLTALHPVGGQLADSVYNDGVRMQSMPAPPGDHRVVKLFMTPSSRLIPVCMYACADTNFGSRFRQRNRHGRFYIRADAKGGCRDSLQIQRAFG